MCQMTVQRDDIEPETQRASTSPWMHDPRFRPPERVPWSELGPDFLKVWGRADPKDPQPEHVEIVGQNGSGKTYLMGTILQDKLRSGSGKTGAVIVCTKKADKCFFKLGWPIAQNWDEVRQHPNVIFWPRTKAMGNQRKDFYDRKISDLLHRLWAEDANVTVAFDEIGYVESLSGDMKALVQQYWREARSLGISVIGMKQRPQGALRDMHSETYWTAAFKPKDRADLERWAELFGARRDWMPVFDSLDRQRREFIIRNPMHDDAYISWVDTPLTPVRVKRKTPSWFGARRAA